MRRRRKAFYILISASSLEGGSHRVRPMHSVTFIIYIIDDKEQTTVRILKTDCNECTFVPPTIQI